MSGSVHHAILHGARPLATDVVEYRFALAPEDADVRWRSGQFISLNCGERDDGLPILRSYSLASRAGADTFALVVKLVEGGPASEYLRALPVDEAVRFTGPMGFFVLDLAHPGDVVLGATGTGIAPFVPMIEDLLERDERGHILLYWGLRELGDLFWREAIDALVERSRGRLTAHVSLTQPPPGWTGARGRITPQIFAALPSLERPTFYLCGNGAMIREVKAGLVERGVERKRQIRTEAFFD